MATYQIYELSARAVMSYAAEQDGVYTFALNRSATEHCKVPGAKHEQDSCAMFHQLMYQLHGKGWRERGEEKVTALSDVLFYMDFAGIFDRRGTGRTQQARREKARDMFRPEGITLDFGSGPHRYVAFERSASMSRQSRLSFIRADLYETHAPADHAEHGTGPMPAQQTLRLQRSHVLQRNPGGRHPH